MRGRQLVSRTIHEERDDRIDILLIVNVLGIQHTWGEINYFS
jgi:hypothetical protein